VSHKVTFNIADSNANVLGCDAVVDEFTTAEFEQGVLDDVEAIFNTLITTDLTPRYYYLGNEPVEWVEGINNPTWSKEDDHIYLSEGNSTRTEKTVVTAVAVNLTDIDTLYIDWQSDGYANNNNETRLRVQTGQTSGHVTGLYFRNVFSRRENSLDVSGLSGNYYLVFSKRKNTSIGSACTGRMYGLRADFNYASSGNRISPPTSLDSYGATSPDLKIKWKADVPSGATVTVGTAITDSDSVLPDEGDWAVQTNGSSIDNLPADLTGMYLRTRIKMTATETSPFLEWLVVYDNADDPYAAVRIDFNDEIKAVPATGTVEFENVDPAADISYTVYILGLNHPNISYDDLSGTVTVVDADVTENVTYDIVSARVTQFYMEVAWTDAAATGPATPTNLQGTPSTDSILWTWEAGS